MSSGRPRGVKNKSGHSAGGARAGSGLIQLFLKQLQIPQQENLVNLFYILLQ